MKNNFSKKFSLEDVVSISDFSRAQIEHILSQAQKIQKLSVSKKTQILKGKVVALLFFEPSTRTKLSFASAVQQLGGSVIGFDDISTTSLVKGESFTDTLKMVEGYADIVVIRHPLDGSARLAADTISKPVINAGDGRNQHPTQTLLDLFTIQESFKKIDGLKIGLCGDLKHYRPFHSLALALSCFKNITLYLVSPSHLDLPKTIREILAKSNNAFVEVTDLKKVLPELDVLYMGRIPKEYFAEDESFEQAKNFITVDKVLLESAKKNLKVMHPLPRVTEIAQEVDETEHALYFQQAANAIPVRQALLQELIKVKKHKPVNSLNLISEIQCTNKTCISHQESIEPKIHETVNQKLYCHYCGKLVE